MSEKRISEEDLRKILKGRGIEPELDGIVAMLDQFPDRIEVVLDGKFTIKKTEVKTEVKVVCPDCHALCILAESSIQTVTLNSGELKAYVDTCWRCGKHFPPISVEISSV